MSAMGDSRSTGEVRFTEIEERRRAERIARLERELEEGMAKVRRHREAAEYWNAVARARGE
jgi:hypothetical protein